MPLMSIGYHDYEGLALNEDEKLRIGPFTDTSKIYAAPKTVSVGDKITLEELVDNLRRAGYGESSSNRRPHLEFDRR